MPQNCNPVVWTHVHLGINLTKKKKMGKTCMLKMTNTPEEKKKIKEDSDKIEG